MSNENLKVTKLAKAAPTVPALARRGTAADSHV
jgi:hypothetical protein